MQRINNRLCVSLIRQRNRAKQEDCKSEIPKINGGWYLKNKMLGK